MTRLVLVEHAPATFRAESGDLVVALTPEACYELDRQGVTYRLTTDFGIDARLAELEPAHWQEQLRWFDAFDELIATHVPETKRWRFGAAALYALNLKTLVDPVRIRALELSAMLDSCDRVSLHRRAESEPPVSVVRVFEGPSVTSRVLPLLARARGLELEERINDTQLQDDRALVTPAAPPAGVLERLRGRLRRSFAGLRGRRPGTREHPLTLLFADFGYDLTFLLTRAREQGHRCLRVVGDAIREERLPPTEVARLPGEGAEGGWVAAAEAVASPDHPLWDWPDGWIPGVALSGVLRPRIVHWLGRVMPLIAARAASFEELIREERVDFVVGANPVDPDVVAAAATTASPTQSVLVDHGHSAGASEVFDLIMLRYVDHNFCATSELARYMEARRDLYDHPTAQVHVGSYQFGRSVSTSRRAQPPQPVPDDRPVVVYALTSTVGSARYLNSPMYGDGWYYRLCREIVDSLARHPEVHSVVKLFPGDGLLRNPIDLYVRDLGLDHVVFSRAPLRAWIPWADRMVFDYPSTGLYETAAAGVPYLALLYRHHRYRPAAVELLGPAAVRFTEPAEAARAVEAFVAAPKASAPRFAPEGAEILATLERIANREG